MKNTRKTATPAESDKKVLDFVQTAIENNMIEKIADRIVELSKAARKNGKARRSDAYVKTYESLLAAGKTCMDCPSDENILILALGIYGWMPTILDTIVYDAKKVNAAIHYLEQGNPIDTPEAIPHFKSLSRLLNNSYVGTSKFLHFLMPDSFAMFDSSIAILLANECKNLKIGRRRAFTSEANDLGRFVLYELAMREAASRAKKSLRDIEKPLFYVNRD